MAKALTITSLAKSAGVSAKTLRLWESRGLLPRAARSHTGYRLFDAESLRYVGFVQRAKALGLTLAETREILRLARKGHCPCPEVVEWTERKIGSLEQEIQSLSDLLARLQRIRQQWVQEGCRAEPCAAGRCSLIADLPESSVCKGGIPDEASLARNRRERGSAGHNSAAGRGGSGGLLSARLPALPLSLDRSSRRAGPPARQLLRRRRQTAAGSDLGWRGPSAPARPGCNNARPVRCASRLCSRRLGPQAKRRAHRDSRTA